MAPKFPAFPRPDRNPNHSKEAGAAQAVARCTEFGPALIKRLTELAADDGREGVLDMKYLGDGSIGFPADLVAANVAAFTGADLFRAFNRSPVYQAWVRHEDDDPRWGPPGRRAMTFTAVSWGRLVLHDMVDLPPRETTFLFETQSGLLYLDTMPAWIAVLDWHPLF